MKRYHDYCDGKMRESDDGEWVRFEDAQLLHQDYQTLYQSQFTDLMDQYMALKAELVRKDAQILEMDRVYGSLMKQIEEFKGQPRNLILTEGHQPGCLCVRCEQTRQMLFSQRQAQTPKTP